MAPNFYRYFQLSNGARLMAHGSLRRSLSLLLVVSLLAPGLASAQPPPIGAQPPPPSGTTMRPVQQAPPAAPAPPRGTTPGPDYRLGPGDVLDVQIAGRLDIVRQQVVVDFVGAINAPPLGAIPVGGVTLLEAHRRVAARAREVFRYAEATTTLIKPRTLDAVAPGDAAPPRTLAQHAPRREPAAAFDRRAALAPPADFVLQPGDALFVPPAATLQDLVEVRGAFNGTSESTKMQVAGKATILQRRELAQGDRVRDVVTRAGGAAGGAGPRPR